MHPRLRAVIIVTVCTILAVTMAVGIANERYGLGIALLLIVIWIAADWAGGAQPDAWALAAVMFGYVVGNRGFAQQSLTSQLPLLPAEAALLIAAPAMLVRSAFGHLSFVRRDVLNYAVLAWMAVGASRLPFDLPVNGVMALRDFAMVYYAAFFFVAQGLEPHAASARVLRGTLTAAFAVLPPVALAYLWAPGFFYDYLSVRGVPLVYHKSDLIATSATAGIFWFWSRWENTGRRVFLIGSATNLLIIPMMASPRAAMVAIAVVSGIWLVARRPRVIGFQLAVATAAAVLALPVAFWSKQDFRETKLYSAYEHAISIFDFSGRRNYVHAESGDLGDNNRFRLVWWRAVATEAIEHNPYVGLGFGHDLAARFLADYDWLRNEDFSVRSPHSMILSVFGRMGALGLAFWLAIAWAMARATLRAARDRNYDRLGLWSVAWVWWISACFGVVLEGPMGAVVFWTVLGKANASAAPSTVSRAAGKSETDARLPAPAAAAE